ncbi:DUF1572 domain-containing protein [Dokdonia sinensis]|uniref:DUF1572 domain-containing protein n=1 Tax=Dokdonia sinensis TaxID=2479847 RepID=A0A3M0G374_9FLAO|nr:DUF1572 family protein [Dokdonia sinensis]RMB56363.1 DUF1572 domain-containing protein [Dokdonia sinensis]
MHKLIIDNLIILFNRDLNKLKEEILLYTEDSNLWKIHKSINNSGGNLCLHLIGNLKTYVGNGLSGNEYTRNRIFEFSGRDVKRTELYREIDDTMTIVEQGLKRLDKQLLEGEFPIKIWKEKKGTLFTLLHLHAHLNYHLGQINYHRRMLE